MLSVLGLATLMTSAALAGTASGTLTPGTTITNNCIITGGSLSFSAYDPLGGAAVTGNTTFSIQCTNLMSAPSVLMDQGLNDNTGTLAAPARRMLATVDSTSYYLNYNLYSNAGASTVWEGVTGVTSPTPNGTAQNMTVYGKIASGQNVPAGSYSDTVTISVNF
jgi:spore coat protein U-like protein